MDSSELHRTLMASTAIHYGLLILWFGSFVWMHEPLYRLHQRWFSLTPGAFDAMHYAGMGLYKLLIAVFCLVPLLAQTLAN